MITNLSEFTLTADKINEILEGVLNNSKVFKVVQTHRSADYESEKGQGEVGEGFDVYDIGQSPVFVKITRSIDSYGDKEDIESIKFVIAQPKTVTSYD